jgi:predicted transcriptional regulator of viral defense system
MHGYHYLSATVPSSFCIAINSIRKVRLNKDIPITLYYWKNEYLNFGISQQKISGYTVLMTDLERSVCDAIRYRNKIGTELCTEIIKNYIARQDRNFSRLDEYAEKLRISRC